jgi:hypothetical protein
MGIFMIILLIFGVLMIIWLIYGDFHDKLLLGC